MGDLALALDSWVGPDPARSRDRPRVDGGKQRRRGAAASERAGMGLAESCDDRTRRHAGARFFGRAGQATFHSHRCAFRLAPADADLNSLRCLLSPDAVLAPGVTDL